MSNEKSAPKTVKDVTFVYTSTNEPQKQLNPENRPPLSTNPLEFHSWEIKILVGESVFKSMKKAFSGAKNFPNVKEFSAAECVEKNFMTELPDEDPSNLTGLLPMVPDVHWGGLSGGGNAVEL